MLAVIGSFRIQPNEGVEPGSDTGWNRAPTLQQTRNLGANTDTILNMALGSHDRAFTIWLSPSRFLALKALLASVQSFTDWDGDIRNVYVKTVRRETGSRPFIVRTQVELTEQ